MFNAEEWAQGFSEKPLQAGWTEATIDEVVMKTSQAGNQYVSVRFALDEYKPTKLWENLNVCHPREDVREIAFRKLANMCLACGFRSIKNPEAPDELENERLRILVADKGGEWTVKAFEPLRKATPKAAETSPTAAPAVPDDDIPF